MNKLLKFLLVVSLTCVSLLTYKCAYAQTKVPKSCDVITLSTKCDTEVSCQTDRVGDTTCYSKPFCYPDRVKYVCDGHDATDAEFNAWNKIRSEKEINKQKQELIQHSQEVIVFSDDGHLCKFNEDGTLPKGELKEHPWCNKDHDMWMQKLTETKLKNNKYSGTPSGNIYQADNYKKFKKQHKKKVEE